ncbi:hypothetical protein GXM_09897 [Nostoc sphaeroides CCNUC1]|uniref:Uncharacterized protein n=1 Tax=Nostoc sphaeroides CCNUC1 TaxID=2653204 RepID=A0A5P8WHR2_9NOSO|nr:hypothetical protein GXM_09897 [Nostoc sphaeroides CCNUC1]
MPTMYGKCLKVGVLKLNQSEQEQLILGVFPKICQHYN